MKLHNPLNPATGLEDASQLPWSDGIPNTGQEGSYPPSAMCVETMDEIVNALVQAGIVPSSSDLFQLTRAIRGGQLDFDATDAGTADAVICQIGLAHNAIAAGLPFTFIKGPAANTGNTVPTLTITDLSGNNGLTGTIVKSGGGALKGGDLPAGALTTVRARAPGVFALVSLLTISDVLALILANNKTVPQPIYPEITTGNGLLGFNVATGSVTIQAGGAWQHRGLNNYVTTGRTDLAFTTAASKVYHLFWDAPGTGAAFPASAAPQGLFTLFDRTAASPVETDASYDTSYDRMLVARVTTDTSNNPTATSLMNRQSLASIYYDSSTGATTSVASGVIQPSYNASPRIVFDTRTAANGGDGAGRCQSLFTYNWARIPKTAPTTASVGYTGISSAAAAPYTFQEGGSSVSLKTITRYNTLMNYQSDYNLSGIVDSSGNFVLTGCFARAEIHVNA